MLSFLKFIFIYFERKIVSSREAEREGERGNPSRLKIVSTEPDTGLCLTHKL